jgi:predicted permease
VIVWRRWVSLVRRRRLDAELDEEIQDHLDRAAARFRANGLSPADARLAALRDFGGVVQAREASLDLRRSPWLDELGQDLRQSLRAFRHYPVAVVVATLSLAMGIGATTSTLEIRDVLFHKAPLLYKEAGQLSRPQLATPTSPLRPTSTVPGALFAVWRTSPLEASLAAATPTRISELRTDDRSSTMRVRAATSNLFSILGVEALVGVARLAPGTVVLSDRAWQTLFDRRPDVVGRLLWIDGVSYAVAGVMPKQFWFASMDTRVWVWLDERTLASEASLEAVARRPARMSSAGLGVQLQGGVNAYAMTLPSGEQDIRLAVSGIEGTPVGRAVSEALPWILTAAVLLTLLIACANVAILVIAEWTAREHELAIRVSLGASRGRLVRSLLVETLGIAGLAGVLGIGMTLVLLRVATSRVGGDATLFDLTVDPRILAQAVALTVVAGVISGVGPAWLETRRLDTNPQRVLAASERVRQKWRHALVVLEVAVTVALLLVTSSLLRTYQRQMTSDPGFNPHPLLALRVENSRGVPRAIVAAALRHLPGVASVVEATGVPYMGIGHLEAVSETAGEHRERAELLAVDEHLFATLDVPLRAGRAFTTADTPATRTALVNETLARRLFPGESAVGKTVRLQGQIYDVIGVVATYADQALQPLDRAAKVFVPLTRDDGATQAIYMIRSNGDPAALVKPVREATLDSAAGNRVASIYTLDQITEIAAQEILVGTAPLAPLVFTGILLTAAGIYGVLAFSVTRRSRELAMRMAVGATRGTVCRLVIAQGMTLIVVGAGLGGAATFALARLVRSFGPDAGFLDIDLVGLAASVALIAVIGVLATSVPSRRAMRLDLAPLLRAL